MEFKDYYQVLGVPRTASDKEIHKAFRKLARQHHPDVNPNDPQAETRFKEINEAHAVLGDPEKRKQYDRYGADWERYQQAAAAGQGAPGADFGQWFSGRPGAGGGPRVEFREFGGDAGEFSDFFSTLFGDDLGLGGRARTRGGGRPMAHRGEDYEHPVEITLEEAHRGGTRLLDLQVAETCPTCGGSGVTGNQRCRTCGGAGQVLRTKRLEARIPAGIQDGGRIRLAGQGAQGHSGGSSGDLYLTVQIRPHERFEREGADLRTTVEIPLYTAMLGGEVTVPSLDGQLALRIPPETQNGRVFRLRGQGLRRSGTSGARGDLLARVNVQLPSNLSERERQLFAQLREAREARTAHAGRAGGAS